MVRHAVHLEGSRTEEVGYPNAALAQFKAPVESHEGVQGVEEIATVRYLVSDQSLDGLGLG